MGEVKKVPFAIAFVLILFAIISFIIVKMNGNKTFLTLGIISFILGGLLIFILGKKADKEKQGKLREEISKKYSNFALWSSQYSRRNKETAPNLALPKKIFIYSENEETIANLKLSVFNKITYSYEDGGHWNISSTPSLSGDTNLSFKKDEKEIWTQKISLNQLKTSNEFKLNYEGKNYKIIIRKNLAIIGSNSSIDLEDLGDYVVIKTRGNPNKDLMKMAVVLYTILFKGKLIVVPGNI